MLLTPDFNRRKKAKLDKPIVPADKFHQLKGYGLHPMVIGAYVTSGIVGGTQEQIPYTMIPALHANDIKGKKLVQFLDVNPAVRFWEDQGTPNEHFESDRFIQEYRRFFNKDEVKAERTDD